MADIQRYRGSDQRMGGIDWRECLPSWPSAVGNVKCRWLTLRTISMGCGSTPNYGVSHSTISRLQEAEREHRS